MASIVVDNNNHEPKKEAIQVNDNYRRIHDQRKSEIDARLANVPIERDRPMFEAKSTRYELAQRLDVTPCGGIGAIHTMAQRIGLPQAIDKKLHLLKRHLPYFESDHVLSLAYNLLAGGTCIQDLEWLRHDLAYMNILGATRIPGPSTAGDFLRRLTPEHCEMLMDAFNGVRQKLWAIQPKAFRREAVLQVDASIVSTTGECKEGADFAYNGTWGYAPLIVSLAGTREPLYIVNRSGNTPSQTDAPYWIDKAIATVKETFQSVSLRGDTAYSLTRNFDRWSNAGVRFVFGYDAVRPVMSRALECEEWERLTRRAKHVIATSPRQKRRRVKDMVVEKRGFRAIHTEWEELAEFTYTPRKCGRPYRVVVVLKMLEIRKGQRRLFGDDVTYHFYITNDFKSSKEDIVFFSNDRADHENDIEQLKNGVHALKTPVGDLVSNWAYMITAGLAWSLKAWMGLLMPDAVTRRDIIRMEFPRFLRSFMLIPAQILRSGRSIVSRIVNYVRSAPAIFAFVERCRALAV